MSQHHQKAWTSADARRWRPRIAATLPAPCVNCGGVVTEDMSWQVGHVRDLAAFAADDYEGSKTSENLGPSHSYGSGPGGRSCNQSAGGRAGAAKTNRKKYDRTVSGSNVVTITKRPKKTTMTTETEADSGFSSSIETTPVPAAAPSLPDPEVFGPGLYPDGGIAPLHLSELSNFMEGRREFLHGAGMLGLNTERKPLHPQQYLVADLMNSIRDDGRPLYRTLAICIPRRASKTTSILAVALGRLSLREDYQVAFTAQSGTKARDRFLKDLVGPLERMFPDKNARPFKINRSRGGEHISFTNGSMIQVFPPIGESFRGDAYDLVIADESQVHSPETTEDLNAGIDPTFDTRPDAQMVAAGTTGEHRSGMLWQKLENGRAGKARTGILEYSAGDYVSELDMADPTVWKRAHPGIDTLTTLETIGERFETLPLDQFGREYLGVWPTGGGGSFIDMDKWRRLGIDGKPEIPEHHTLGIAVEPNQRSAAIVAVWRDQDDAAHMYVIEHKAGVRWLVPAVIKHSRGNRKIYWAHDTFGAMLVEVEALQRHPARPLLAPQSMADVKTGAATLLKDLDDSKLHHYKQESLDEAAEKTIKRKIGFGWGIGPANRDEDDIVPLEAVTYALHAYDGIVPAPPLESMFA
jgi:hypothetical protein